MQPEQDRKALLRKALTALDEMKAKLDASEQAKAEPIAVVGMSCRFPGGANSPEDFWNLLIEGRDAVSEVPTDRWTADDFAALNGGEAPTCYGGFLDQVDQFDPHFFGISPREAISLDPQQRLVLEVAWEALERGGIAPDRLRNTLTGVFLGITTNDYSQLTRAASELDVYMATGGALNAAAGRVAYTLGLQGPCMAIDSACSSSLVAVHAACQSLRLGESDMALAGGVNVLLTPEPFVCFTNWGMMAPDGRCKTFDASADGFVRSEGCGIVVLKRLSDALADGDRVLAVVRGSAVNQDGRSSGFTVPSGLAQRAVVQQALERAGVAPADVGYVEAHGTGTSLGDPIEVEALGAALAEGRTDDRPLVLGSAKTNIGHCESASGIAGFIKTVLALQHNEIPPHLHIEERSPRIPWPDFAIEIPTAPMPWPVGYPRRIAGVSSFGFSGTNAHVVLEEAPARETAAASDATASPQLLTLSAKTGPALQDLARRYHTYLREEEVPFAEVCHTALAGRAQFKHRLSIVASDAEAAADKLADFIDGHVGPGMASGEVPQSVSGVAFLFTGQGAQYVGMGRALYGEEPVFREALDRCDELLTPLLGRSIIELMHGSDDEDSLLHQTAYTQPALFSIEYGLCALWRSYGVEPSVLLGHSIGELVAACVAGVFGLEDALRLVAARGRLMQALPQGGAMAAVTATPDRVEKAVAESEGTISVAAYNGPEHIVISGEEAAVEKATSVFEVEDVEVRRLKVSHAFHSALMEPMLDAFRHEAERVRYAAPQLPLVSNVTGRLAGAEVARTDYWVEHVRAAVRFDEGMQTLWEQGYRTFIEIGPHPVLTGMGQACVEPGAGVWAGSLRRGRPDGEQLLEAVGALYVAGVDVDRTPPASVRRAALPTYPFQRKRYWVEQKGGRPAPLIGKMARQGSHPLLGAPLRSPAINGTVFHSTLSVESLPYLGDHRIHGTVLLPATAYLELAIAAAQQVFGPESVHVESLSIERPLLLPTEDGVEVQVVVSEEDENSRSVEIYSAASEGDWVRHGVGRVARSPDEPEVEPASPAVQRARLGEGLDVTAYYEKLRAVGAEYGPAFHGVSELYGGDGEALGRIVLPQDAGSPKAYAVHPALLDACFHVAGAALPTSNDADESVYVPVEVGRFDVYTPGVSEAWCWVEVEKQDQQGGGVFVCTVHIMSVQGKRVATLSGLKIKRVDATSFLRHQARGGQDWLYEVVWETASDHDFAPAEHAPGDWIVFADGRGVAAAVAAHLEQAGHTCTLILRDAGSSNTSTSPVHYRQVLSKATARAESLRGILYLWPLGDYETDAPDLAAHLQIHDLMLATQALVETGVRGPLWIVTSGAYMLEGDVRPPAPDQAPLWGFGRTLMLEIPALRPTLVDLDPLADDATVRVLSELLDQHTDRREIAVRGEQRYVAQLKCVEDVPTSEARGPGDQPFVVEVSERGSLDNLTFQPRGLVHPGPGEVAIRMHATGLNFRDVLNVLGMYPGDAGQLGLEGAGTVVEVGEGVTAFQRGDAVLTLASGAFGTFVTTPQELVVEKPENLTFYEAATTPVTFLTSYYGLHRIARLQSGERVLIHAAAGGVGMAAVQIAQEIGAEVFATAGSPRKRAYLRSLGVRHVMDSRALDFADEIMEVTNGEGVDVVLNALTGEAIPKSLSVLARGGRFLEIGKREILTAEQVAEINDDVSYVFYDLADLAQNDPSQIQAMLQHLAAQFRAGTLRPLPMRVFPMQKVQEAYKYMARALHIGKVVVSQVSDSERTPGEAGWVRSDATYVVTGGLGGLGLEAAHLLAERGARHLVLLSRRGGEAASEKLERLKETGAQVEVYQADVAERDELARVFDDVARRLPPVRGVIHAAGVLRDGLLEHQTWSQYEDVLAPKVTGTWNLHTLTRDLELDFFVLFSSGSAVLGSPAQSNYAAGNAFMDALAAQRRAQGLPAISISWGPWDGIGMAAALSPQQKARLEDGGAVFLEPLHGVEVLEMLVRAGTVSPAGVAVLPMDWDALARQGGGSQLPSLLASELERRHAGTQEPACDQDWLENLYEITASEQRSEIEAMLCRAVANVLRLKPTEINAAEPLVQLGLDSLMTVELRNAVGRLVGQTLPSTLVFEYPTINELTEYLADEILKVGTEGGGEVPHVGDGDAGLGALGDLDDLSDQEIAALLDSKLDTLSSKKKTR